MTKKEKLLVLDLIVNAKAIANGHTGIKELLKESIKKVEEILKK